MSRSSNIKSVPKKINSANADTLFWKLEESDEGKAPIMKSTISLGGAITNQWKDGNQLFYWPQFRLAGDSGTLYSFAVDNNLIEEATKKTPVTIGPLIGNKAEEGSKPVAGVFQAVISMEKGVLEVDDQEIDEMIPMYDISVESNKSGEVLTSTPYTKGHTLQVGDEKNPKTMKVAKEYTADGYFAIEKELVKAGKADKAKKTSKFTFEDMEMQAYGTTDSEGKKSTKKKSSKSKDVPTLKDLVKRVEEYRKEKKEKHARMDITKLAKNLTDGTIKKHDKFTSNHVYALPSDHEYHDLFILNKSLAPEQNPINFYNLFTDDEDEAEKMLSKAMKKGEPVLTETKTKSSSTTTSKSKSPAKSKKIIDDDEEEEKKDKKSKSSKSEKSKVEKSKKELTSDDDDDEEKPVISKSPTKKKEPTKPSSKPNTQPRKKPTVQDDEEDEDSD
jgi:hypothetical protein